MKNDESVHVGAMASPQKVGGAEQPIKLVTTEQSRVGAGVVIELGPRWAAEWLRRGWAKHIGKSAALAVLLLILTITKSHAAAVRTEMVASGTYTSANSAAFSLSTSNLLMVGVDVTSCTGAGRFDIWVQTSDDGGATWFDYPADLVLSGTGPTPNATAGVLNGTTTAVATPPGQRNITGFAGHAVTTANGYVGVYRGIASDRYRVRWLVTFTSCVFSVSSVAK